MADFAELAKAMSGAYEKAQGDIPRFGVSTGFREKSEQKELN
jgi:hypothetical protein